MILYTEGKNKSQESEAEKVMGILCAAYPGHPWAVRVDDGIIFIRHLQFGGNWGMNIKTREVDYDAAVLKKKVIMLAGEWLERAGLVRGRENGDEVSSVEGLPDKWQPVPQNTPPVKFESVVVASDYEPLRTQARPQVVREVLKSG